MKINIRMAEMNDLIMAQLHKHTQCEEKDEDIDRMERRLEEDPGCLDALQYPPMFCGALTPLQSAVHIRHERCAEFLIKKGANIDIPNEGGSTALYIACYGERTSLVKLLLDKGANPNYEIPNSNRQRCWYFYLACSFGFSEIANLLISYGSAVEDFWSTGLLSGAQVAAFKNHPDCLLIALKHGAVTDRDQLPATQQFESVQYYSLLHHSLQGKSFFTRESINCVIKIWIILRHFGANFQFRDSKNRTAYSQLVKKHMSEEHSDILVQAFKEIMNAPLSLQSLSRIAIRSAIGCSNCLVNIPKLKCLPVAVRDFLKFKDFDAEESNLCQYQFDKG